MTGAVLWVPDRAELLPAEMREWPQFCNWSLEQEDGAPKASKIPRRPHNLIRGASSTDPAHWSSFDVSASAATQAIRRPFRSSNRLLTDHVGLGFVFSEADPYVFIDLDGALDEDGNIKPAAQRIVDGLASWTEISVSRRGLHIVIRADVSAIPELQSNCKAPGDGFDIEIYHRARFVALTGNVHADSPHTIHERTRELAELARELWPAQPRRAPPRARPRHTSADRERLIQRAEKYIAQIPGAISGAGGHDQTWLVVQHLLYGFDLTVDEARPLLEAYSARCDPPWDQRQIDHKLANCELRSRLSRGYLLGDDTPPWSSFTDEEPPLEDDPPAADEDPAVTHARACEKWPEPLSLDDPTRPKLPLDGLPDWLRELVVEGAEHIQIAPCALLSMALAAWSAAASGLATLEVRPGYHEPLQLWWMLLLASGERKSAVHSLCTRPLAAWEAEQAEKLQPEIAESRAMRVVLEKRLSRAQQAAAAKDAGPIAEDDVRTLARELEDHEQITAPRVQCDDVTPERVIGLLAEQRGRIALLSAQGGWLDRATRRRARPTHDPQATPYLESQQHIRRVYLQLPEDIRPAFAVGAFAGLRKNEILALQWSDVDLKRRRLRVQRQKVHGKHEVGPTKTDKARVAPINNVLLGVLKSWKLRCRPGLWCFPSTKWADQSRMMDDHTLNDALDEAFGELPDIPRVTWYQATRHTFASHWIRDGRPMAKLQRILGHASITTTERYAHLSPDAFDEKDYGAVDVDLSEAAVLDLRCHSIATGSGSKPGGVR